MGRLNQPINWSNCQFSGAPLIQIQYSEKEFRTKIAEVEALIMADRGKSRELEAKVLEKVAEVISAMKNAKHVDQVISSLHSLAVLLFPVDASTISGQSRHQRFSHFQSL